MRKKFFSLILFILILLVAFLFNAQGSNAESPAFEYSSNNDVYVYEASGSNLLGYVWTKTGDIVSVFDIDSANQKTKDNKTSNPATQTSGNSTAYLSATGFLGASSMAKILGPGHTVFAAAGHPWVFLMTLSFGTLIFSLWFLRHSTGVSPPTGPEALWAGGLRLYSSH